MATDSRKILKYARVEIGGVEMRPDSRELILRAIKDDAEIEVYSGNDYINLYHVYERILANNPRKYGKLRVVRRQIGPSTWRLLMAGTDDSVDDRDEAFQPGYNPKRGRYKRWVEQLEKGELLSFSDEREAVKVRRAWFLYVRPEGRTERRVVKKKVRGKFQLSVVSRNGRGSL